jgi:hypothetical protein
MGILTCPGGIEGEDGGRLAARRVTCAGIPRMGRESKRSCGFGSAFAKSLIG